MLEIALAIPAQNERKIEANNSAGQGLFQFFIFILNFSCYLIEINDLILNSSSN